MGSTRIKIAAYLVSIAYSVALGVSGLHLPSTTAKVLGFLPAILVALFAIFDRWLWRIGPLPQLLHRPLLAGSWHGQLLSYRDDATGRETVFPAVPVAIVIHQTFTTVSVTLLTGESKSRSVAESILHNTNSDFTLHYQYNNVAALEHRDRSPNHAGSAVLDVGAPKPTRLRGEYWTARRTRGTFDGALIDRKIRSTLEEVAAAAAATTGGR